MPDFAIFFPVDIAIALTGVVHFANNIFKMALIGKKADKAILIRFGIPAILAAFLGAWVLVRISVLPAIFQYSMWGRDFEITPVKLLIAVLLMSFAILELLPAFQKVQFKRNYMIAGGALSGFFGGLAGIQGALRSAFLIKSGLSKEAYIATGVIIASLVDITRLSVYATRFRSSGLSENTVLIISAILAAIGGAAIGNLLLKKVTYGSIRVLVAVMLFLVSLAMGTGII
jgi:uncharacterized membrane protein YfcA